MMLLYIYHSLCGFSLNIKKNVCLFYSSLKKLEIINFFNIFFQYIWPVFGRLVHTTGSVYQHYSKLRKNVRVTQSQNVPLSCLSWQLADRLAEAAYRDILGLSYARAFSAEWNIADRGLLRKVHS